jgi:hypothetical protein
VNIPDYIEPFIAYRTWYVDNQGLTSLNHVAWTPGEPLTAECPREKSGCPHPPEIPFLQCSCGVYAAKNFKHLVSIGYHECGIHGEVYLWGRIVDHQLGYRAQFAYPKNFVVPEDVLPFKVQDILKVLQTMELYGVPIYFMRSRSNFEDKTLLWTAEGGMQGQGLTELLDRRAKWYEKHKRQHVLELGDRVFLRGKNPLTSRDGTRIAIVQEILEKDSPSFWNKRYRDGKRVVLHLAGDSIIVPRFETIVWDDQNGHWMTTATGPIQTQKRPSN